MEENKVQETTPVVNQTTSLVDTKQSNNKVIWIVLGVVVLFMLLICCCCSIAFFSDPNSFDKVHPNGGDRVDWDTVDHDYSR
jgi:hypothetical protein